MVPCRLELLTCENGKCHYSTISVVYLCTRPVAKVETQLCLRQLCVLTGGAARGNRRTYDVLYLKTSYNMCLVYDTVMLSECLSLLQVNLPSKGFLLDEFYNFSVSSAAAALLTLSLIHI